MTDLRSLPSVDQLLRVTQVNEWVDSYGRPLTVQAVRAALQDARTRYPDRGGVPGQEDLLRQAERLLETWTTPSLQPLINATGVILHTNLGRAPLSEAALTTIHEISLGYSNLEFDLKKGGRGSRLVHAEELIKQLTGAESALVVNNNASAVLLVLTALASRRSVVIARSQLVEIGGGFRLPDVMKQSRARLVEVGTTNRVHLADYENALQERSIALFLRAHRSNFKIIGFTSEPSLAEMVQVAHNAGIPVVDDLGSGTLLDTSRFGLGHEPMVQESLTAGADLVCFSGDKLLGGPQAGIIAGRAELVSKLKKHPLARAVRADKICLAALSATLLHYLRNEAESEIPIWRMIATPPEQLKARAYQWRSYVDSGMVIQGESTVGGGSLPGETLPSSLLSLDLPNPHRIMQRLRQRRPAIIARLQDEGILLDPRTVLPEQDQSLLEGLAEVIKV